MVQKQACVISMLLKNVEDKISNSKNRFSMSKEESVVLKRQSNKVSCYQPSSLTQPSIYNDVRQSRDLTVSRVSSFTSVSSQKPLTASTTPNNLVWNLDLPHYFRWLGYAIMVTVVTGSSSVVVWWALVGRMTGE